MRFCVFLLFLFGTSGSAQTSGIKGPFSTVSSFLNLQIKRVAVDSGGTIVVTGTTNQPGLPTTPNAIQRDYRPTSCFAALPPLNRPCFDSYIARISSSGAVLYGSYFGGSCDDNVTGMAIDEANAIYLVGATCSGDFPFSKPAPVLNGSSAFLVKIAADGTWNFAVGLPASVTVNQIRAAGSGEIAVGGECALNSIAWTAQFLPPNATPRTGACYLRLANNGIDIVAATLIGASNEALATDMVLDASGNAYLAGKTFPLGFPTNAQSWVSTTPQTFALFAAKVSRDGKTLLATAMFNGEAFEGDPKIAVDPSGEVVVAGTTQSLHFPVTPGAFQTVRMGEIYNANLFVVKLNPSLSAPVFSTILTGEGADDLGSVWANADGSVTLIGETHSTMFPTTLDAQERCLTADYYPTFVPYLAQLAADGKSLVYSSFLNQGPKGSFLAATDYGHGPTVLALASGTIVLRDPAQPPSLPKFCAMNAANFYGTGVTPGEILTIFGSNLGDAQIMIAGQPAPILYASDGQVNAIVPDGLPEGSTATIAALHQGLVTDHIDFPVVSYVAGLFRDYTTPIVDATLDDGTLITPANPARPGSIMRVWGTGFGNTHPVIRVGSTIAPPVSSRFANGVTEFRVLVPQMPAGQTQLMIDFSITGIAFQATGLKLPVAPAAQ